MAHPKWLNKYLTMKSDVKQIFEDLEQFKTFCVDYGHVYDERNLYNNHNQTYQDFLRFKDGRHVRNQWNSRGEERKEFRPRDRNGPRGNNNYRSGNGYNRNA